MGITESSVQLHPLTRSRSIASEELHCEWDPGLSPPLQDEGDGGLTLGSNEKWTAKTNKHNCMERK